MKQSFLVYDICALSDHQHEDLLVSRFAPYLQKHQNLSLPYKHTFYHIVPFTNFTDNSYFTKFFKKYTGLTPEEFIKNTLSYDNIR